MSRLFYMDPPADDRLQPGDRVLVQVRPRRPRRAGVVVDVRHLGRGELHVLVQMNDGELVVRRHAEVRRSGWQPCER